MIGGSIKLKKSVCLKVYDTSFESAVGIRPDHQGVSETTHQHLPNDMPRRQPDNEAYEHAREYRYNCLMHGSYSFDLEVIRRPERQDEQHANEEERP